MPSSTTSNNGTGFGGASCDTMRIATSLQRAQIRTRQDDKQMMLYLNYMKKVLLDHWENRDFLESFCSSDRSIKLQNVLQEVLRNHSLAEWEKRGEVLMAALRVCQLLASDLQLAGHFFNINHNNDDNDAKKNDNKADESSSASPSLLLSIEALAEQAKLVAKHELGGNCNLNYSPATRETESSSDDDDIAISTLLLRVRDDARGAVSQLSNDNAGKLETHQPNSLEHIYKERLGKLRVEFVDDLPCHAFQTKSYKSNAMQGTQIGFNRRLYKELVSYQASLPIELGSSIFLRVKNSQINLIRALIIGAENTPYANGCFVFDIFLPPKYPETSPKVKFCTTGGGKVRFNPNLYNNGKVCLSLLGTWSGPGWIPNQSTLLQVLLSIQSLIFVPDPYFNEPGWDIHRNTPQGTRYSEKYNANIHEFTWKYAIMEPLQQIIYSTTGSAKSTTAGFSTPEFTQVIIGHFQCKSQAIIDQMEAWFSSTQYPEVQSKPSSRSVSLRSMMGLRHLRGGNVIVTVDNHSTRVQKVKALLEQLVVNTPLDSATDIPAQEAKSGTLQEEHHSLAQATASHDLVASDSSLLSSPGSRISYDTVRSGVAAIEPNSQPESVS